MAGIHASLWMILSFIGSCVLFYHINNAPEIHVNLFTWIKAGNLTVPFAFIIDQLSVIMMMVITGVGALIHIYSIGYMHGDDGFNRFFSYLNLFVFFMLILVMADNYVLMFVGWEGVGLCSWLLIGFWYKNMENNKAANKAFIMNRIGDLAMLFAMFFIFNEFGTFIFKDIVASPQLSVISPNRIMLITLLLFFASTGKSAQIPLFTWLPDAMAGPTPVSALIHAATMVTAGIYLIIRNNILFSMSPITMDVVMITGIVTALFAGTIALKQNDIKKVLAYSTVSQLGLMFFALGLGAFDAAFFHLLTHAFFKALLFLGAGSVIHGLQGEQDIRKMGGLKNHMKITHITFLIGVLAIIALPPFSGFFSKDGILLAAFEKSPLFWVLGLTSGLLTVLYMMRLYLLTFFGQPRMDENTLEKIHESPAQITFPLTVLAVLAFSGGMLNMPEIFYGNKWLTNFLSPQLAVRASHTDHLLEWALIFISLSGIILVSLFAYFKFIKNIETKNQQSTRLGQWMSSGYFVDEIYSAVITKPVHKLSDFLYSVFDLKVLDGAVNKTGKTALNISGILKETQNGNISYYLFAMALGVGGILFLFLLY